MKASEWKVGMSSCYQADITRELFEEYAAAAIDMMEVSLCNAEQKDIDWAGIRKNAEAVGVRLWSFHLPFYPLHLVNIASLDPEIRRSSMRILGERLKIAGELGVTVAVIHPSGEPNKQEERQEQLSYAAECLASLAETAACSGVTLAVEDLPRTCLGNCAADIAFLLNADPRLRVCFDTNHLLEEDNLSFIKALGNQIVTLHVSDYDLRNERHWLPGEGKNDWRAIVTALEEAGYTGPWMYEIGRSAPSHISRPRPLTCADFYRNYKECTAKAPLTVIGTPNEAVCLESAYIH